MNFILNLLLAMPNLHKRASQDAVLLANARSMYKALLHRTA